MLTHFTSRFIKGFIALFPLALSVLILAWLFTTAESLTRNLLLFFLPDQAYIPGLGILTAVLFIYLLGSLIDKPGVGRVLKWVEEPFQILPLVKTVYRAVKDFTGYLSPRSDRQRSRVVSIRWPGSEIDLIGLVTRESLSDLPPEVGGHDRIAVYLPMSYQFGGYTIFVARSQVKELPLKTEATLRSVLTAWVSAGGQND